MTERDSTTYVREGTSFTAHAVVNLGLNVTSLVRTSSCSLQSEIRSVKRLAGATESNLLVVVVGTKRAMAGMSGHLSLVYVGA